MRGLNRKGGFRRGTRQLMPRGSQDDKLPEQRKPSSSAALHTDQNVSHKSILQCAGTIKSVRPMQPLTSSGTSPRRRLIVDSHSFSLMALLKRELHQETAELDFSATKPHAARAGSLTELKVPKPHARSGARCASQIHISALKTAPPRTSLPSQAVHPL